MIITTTDFKKNISKYFFLVENEDIYITKHGRIVARLVSTRNDQILVLRSLRGIIKGTGATLESIREERLDK